MTPDNETNSKPTVKKQTVLVIGAIVLFAVLIIALLISFSKIRKMESQKAAPDSVASAGELSVGDTLKTANVGDIVSFGCYKQDYDTYADPEPLEWVVIKEKDGALLLVTKYVIDVRKFDTGGYHNDGTWESSGIREWLNGEFFNTAFNVTEQTLIKETSLSTTYEYKQFLRVGYGGFSESTDKQIKSCETTDRVFLLSEGEVSETAGKKCGATDYAIANGLFVSDSYAVGGQPTCCWFLRNARVYNRVREGVLTDVYVECMCTDGTSDHKNAEDYNAGVRPAIWVTIP